MQVLLKGFITIQVWDKGKLCKVYTIPFKVMEEFILCAPKGTFLNCKITNFDCLAYFTDDCKRINVAISFCQQVQMVSNVNIEIGAKLCHPHAI
uniref:hypothetical protein n=1 Tax=Oceanobacillus profundus TaxID=372463 RepID=UPI0036D3EBE3